MAQTITPVVHGGRRARWAAAVALHALGAALSAAVFGAVLGALGGALGAPWGRAGAGAVVVIALAYALREVFGLRLPVPAARRQVPEWWRTSFSPHAAAFLYGLGLGVGFFTYLAHGTLLVVSAAAFASGRPLVGGLMLAPFGMARGLGVLAAAESTTWERVGRTTARLEALALRPLRRWANGLVLVAVAGAALAAAAGEGRPGRPAVALLAALFAWAAAAKLMDLRRWRSLLAGYRLGPAKPLAALAVPAAEAAVAVLAAVGRPTHAGALALALLGGFSIAVLRARRLHGTRVPCGCFGNRRRRDYRLILVRNAGLALLAVAALGAEPYNGLSALGVPRAHQVLPAVLTGVGLVAGLLLIRWAVRLLRDGRPPVSVEAHGPPSSDPATAWGWQEGRR